MLIRGEWIGFYCSVSWQFMFSGSLLGRWAVVAGYHAFAHGSAAFHNPKFRAGAQGGIIRAAGVEVVQPGLQRLAESGVLKRGKHDAEHVAAAFGREVRAVAFGGEVRAAADALRERSGGEIFAAVSEENNGGGKHGVQAT